MKLFDLNEAIFDEVIKRCLDFLMSEGGSAIANGKHLVDEEGMFVNVSEYTTLLSGAGKWEAHKEYADFQLVLEGAEYIYVSDIHKLETGEFDPEKDYMECFGEAEGAYVIDSKKGMLLMPEDAHMPCVCIDNTPSKVKKAVFKVPVSYFEGR